MPTTWCDFPYLLTSSLPSPQLHWPPVDFFMAVDICYTTLWISHKYTYVFSPDPPSHPPTTSYPSRLSFLCYTAISHWLSIFNSVQFSRSVVSDSLRSHDSQHARPPCPSPTHGVHSNSCPSRWWCHPAISSSVVPFSSCAQSLPASGSFPMSQVFASGGRSIGSFSFSISPSNGHLHMTMYVSVLLSQFIPSSPSSTVSADLFSMSVSIPALQIASPVPFSCWLMTWSHLCLECPSPRYLCSYFPLLHQAFIQVPLTYSNIEYNSFIYNTYNL